MQRFGGKYRVHKGDQEGAAIKVGGKSVERGIYETRDRETFPDQLFLVCGTENNILRD